MVIFVQVFFDLYLNLVFPLKMVLLLFYHTDLVSSGLEAPSDWDDHGHEIQYAVSLFASVSKVQCYLAIPVQI